MLGRLKMKTMNFTECNIIKIAEIFPNVISEDENGKVIDFDILKQELSNYIIDGYKEKYSLNWPGKKQGQLSANTPIFKTLRPCQQESVNFDLSQNIYIEGDNLEALKLLQETYLNKVKMIYIDPPYNTGKDFVYKDNFTSDKNEELESSSQISDEGRLVANLESNGRYHSDWLSMIYPRLKLSRNLLKADGVICISIDDNEVHNLRKLCDEIFGENNFVGEIIRKTKSMTGDEGSGFNLQHENLIIYSKNKVKLLLNGEEKDFANYKNPDNDINGDWTSGDPSAKSGGDSTYFEIINPYTKQSDYPPMGRFWAFSKQSLEKYIANGKIIFKKEYKENERGFVFKRYKNELKSRYNPVNSLFSIENDYMNQAGTKELKSLLNGEYFDNPKPTKFIQKIIQYSTDTNDIILDFFSGSATTAHAVMQLNAEDGGNRRFIMVQIPEETDEKSEAYKTGYKTICEIGKERIRRAGAKILEENKDKEGIENLDIGFRVFKVDSSNMKDVYYNPDEIRQDNLFDMVSNIKEDRTDLDLLFQVLLDSGVELTLPIEEKQIVGKKVYFVDGNVLSACFEDNLTEEFVTELAKCEDLLKVVFRDSSFGSDDSRINVEQIFKQYSPDTQIRVI